MAHERYPDEVGSVPFSEQVGLVLRAYRRQHGLSQRAFAEVVHVPQQTVARLERSAAQCSLTTILTVLSTIGHTLGVVDAEGVLVSDWNSTDLHARDRSGRRFPAHRDVRPVTPGGLQPLWWTLHEDLGTGKCGPQPTWTAEGFPIPPGTRFGRKPRPYAPGEGPRFPFASLLAPSAVPQHESSPETEGRGVVVARRQIDPPGEST